MNQPKLFARMRGEEVLRFCHDHLLEEAHRKRTLIESCYKIANTTKVSAEEMQHIRAIEASADILLFLIGTGVVARDKRHRGDEEILEVIAKAAQQARVALVEALPDIKDEAALASV